MSDANGNFMLVLAVAVVAVAILLAGQAIYWSLLSRRESQSRELSRRIGSLQEQEIAPLFRLGQARTTGLTASIDEMVRQAGSPYGVEGVYQRMAGGGALGVLAAFAVFKGPMAILGLAGAALPVLLLSNAAAARATKLTEQLPDALDLLGRSLSAGHGISEAMRMAAEELPMPIAGEFGRVYEENNLGRDFRECIQNLCRRNPRSFDLRIFASSVLLQRDTGGNLIEILHGIANTIRNRFVFQGKVVALTSEARFTAWILGGLPFVIGGLIAFVSPHYLTPLVDDPLGRAGMLFFMMWFCTGIFFMRELSKVDV